MDLSKGVVVLSEEVVLVLLPHSCEVPSSESMRNGFGQRNKESHLMKGIFDERRFDFALSKLSPDASISNGYLRGYSRCLRSTSDESNPS